MTAGIRILDRASAPVHLDALVDLLVDSVRNGASVGFLWPLDRPVASQYWEHVFDEIGDDFFLFVAESDGRIVGSVQLARCLKQNGRHRAEVQKLFVHSEFRGRGISKGLLAAAEARAAEAGCTLLILDTEAGSPAEAIYQHLGWRKAGEIPMFAGKPGGELISTAYHYKMIPPPPKVELVTPGREHLASFVSALKSGWHSNNLRRGDAAREALEEIERDSDDYLARQIDREARGGPVKMPDGSEVPRLPGYILWMWDGEYCGSIGFRWQPGTTALPPHTLGHIGYGVVPWKRQRGYAKHALGLMLASIRKEGLPHVEVTCDTDNVASQRTIVANGGILVERFLPPPACGHAEKLRYRIAIKS